MRRQTSRFGTHKPTVSPRNTPLATLSSPMQSGGSSHYFQILQHSPLTCAKIFQFVTARSVAAAVAYCTQLSCRDNICLICSVKMATYDAPPWAILYTRTDRHNSTNISASFCQFHSYFLWMGKLWICDNKSMCWGTEIHACQSQQVTLVRYSDQRAATLQGREPLTLSQTHNRTQIARHCSVQFLFTVSRTQLHQVEVGLQMCRN
jgi:hypothetical protein